MDRVIPKDLIDLIYKESHLDKIKRLNAEYHRFFVLKFDSILYIGDNRIKSHINDRDLSSLWYKTVWKFKTNICTGKLPKMYFYSSGHFGLKWIE